MSRPGPQCFTSGKPGVAHGLSWSGDDSAEGTTRGGAGELAGASFIAVDASEALLAEHRKVFLTTSHFTG